MTYIFKDVRNARWVKKSQTQQSLPQEENLVVKEEQTALQRIITLMTKTPQYQSKCLSSEYST